MQRRTRGYSLLMVLMLMGLLGVAVGGLFAVILRGAQSSGAMIDRRTTFYACDGMGRQLASLGQAFLSRNTLEDVPESRMQRELRTSLPLITPLGFTADPRELVIPERELPDPAPIEVITTGPFSGLEVKLQVFDMRFAAKRNASGAVCRTEQTLSLGRIALFQFFVFADLPLLDIAPPDDQGLLLRGRIHTNGRTCLGGQEAVDAFKDVRGSYSVRFDANITAVNRILHANNAACGFGGFGSVGIIGEKARGPARPPPARDRLFDDDLFERFNAGNDSGCLESGFRCDGGWRAFALAKFRGRMQDRDHEVQELTLPVDPPEMRSQRGWASNRTTVEQRMRAGPSRPNTRFLVEPVITNDPTGFARNKLAFKAQIRIIDGVWYLKDPGADNNIAVDGDDGPWPGIPIWSDHPGEFTTATPAMNREGVEGAEPLQVGQSDIRSRVDTSDDPRLLKAKWNKRAALGAPPTPRRFSYYAFVDRTQAQSAGSRLNPPGMGLQFGRVRRSSSGSNDTDPPAVVSYGGITPVFLAGSLSSSSFPFSSGGATFSGHEDGSPPTSGEQSYWMPGVRMTDDRFDVTRRLSYAPRPSSVGFCGGASEQIGVVRGNEIVSNVMLPAVPQPLVRHTDDGDEFYTAVGFPAPNSPLPSNGVELEYASGDSSGWRGGRLCHADNDEEFRKRMRLGLLESTRTGFVDTNNHDDTRLNGPARENVLPLNFNLHAFQEAMADKTPGELGSYFCSGCLWESFTGTVFITNTWKGSMLGGAGFPNGEAAPPPNPVADDRADVGDLLAQPRAPRETRSTTGPLPYELCAAPSDEAGTALAQVVGHRFLDADEADAFNSSGNLTSSFDAPFQRNDPPSPSLPSSNNNEIFRRQMDNPMIPAPTPAEPTASLPDDLRRSTANIRGSFRIPECAHYSTVNGKWRDVRATSVRLINGRTLNFNASKCGAGRNQPCQPQLSPTADHQLDPGLNIVSNVPVYIAGDINQSSEVDDVETGARAADWIPFMVAGDTVTTLSNAWDDEHSRWGVSTTNGDLNPASPFTPRPAQDTRYHMLLLTGIVGAGVYGSGRDIVPTRSSGGGLPGAMRLMEHWDGQEHVFRGAIVLGWMPVFTQWKVADPATRSYQPPGVRDWQFDRHLNATINQPPDSPVFDVTALRSWRRE